jgi:hypothetical protein
MKRKITILGTSVTVIAASALVLGISVTNPPPPTLPPTLQSTSTVPTPPRWKEDSLPPILYLWADQYGGDLVGPRRADRWANAVWPRDKIHHGCYAATGPTTLIMCPGGFLAYS